MTIRTRNEVLVTCQDAPLMELLQHLAKDHAPDLDYCLNLMDWYDDREPKAETQTARTRQEFLDLPLGTVVKIPHVGTYYKTAINAWAWVKAKNLPLSTPSHGNDDMANFTISVNAPATILFTPEVQA